MLEILCHCFNLNPTQLSIVIGSFGIVVVTIMEKILRDLTLIITWKIALVSKKDQL